MSNIQNQAYMHKLAQTIARQCFKKKSLNDITHYIDSMNDTKEDSLKKEFMKNVLMEISKRYFFNLEEYTLVFCSLFRSSYKTKWSCWL